MAYKKVLTNVCADSNEINAIQGKIVKSIENVDDGVLITFQGDSGESTELHIGENSELYISKDTSVSPVFSMQWFRELRGYKIIDVCSDDLDLNGEIFLSNDEGDMVRIQLDNSVLDGESIYVIKDKESEEA